MSSNRPAKIMIVEPDPRVSEMLVDCLGRHFAARVTCAASGEDALDVEMFEPHDLAVADYDLPGLDGVELLGHLKELSKRPVILTSNRPTLGQAIEALRLGADDFLPKPFSMPYLLEAADRLVTGYQRECRRLRKYHRLRRRMRVVQRDRRELNERIDLICRDLVSAHRRLVHRVLEHEQATGG